MLELVQEEKIGICKAIAPYPNEVWAKIISSPDWA